MCFTLCVGEILVLILIHIFEWIIIYYNFIHVGDKLIRLKLFIQTVYCILRILSDIQIPKKFWNNRNLNWEGFWVWWCGLQGLNREGSELGQVWVTRVWVGWVWPLPRGLNCPGAGYSKAFKVSLFISCSRNCN